MEPIVVYRLAPGRVPPEGARLFATAGPGTEGVFLFRADFDALAAEAADARTLRAERDSLVKERDDWRDTSMAAYAAAHGLDWQSLTKEQLDAMESDGKAHGDKKAMDVVRRLYASYAAATARAHKAEALLREARGWLAALLKIGADKPAVDALLARIDALLEGKA